MAKGQIKYEWDIGQFSDLADEEYRGKFSISLYVIDVNVEDAAKVVSDYWGDWEISTILGMDIRDYTFYMAKWGMAQKCKGNSLYWDNREDAQCAIDWLTGKMALDKLTE